MADRHFGQIESIPVGTIFSNREQLAAAGIHRPPQAGLSGSGKEGADSIGVSGEYEDDED
jgi:putative restriction endonuclease